MSDDSWVPPPVLLAVDLVILTLRDSRLHVLLVERGIEPYQGMPALPGGFLNHAEEDLLTAAHRELAEEAGLEADHLHLEQLGVYGTPGRDPRGRVVSVAYLAIAPRLPEPVAGTDASDARWIPTDQALSGKTRLAFDHQEIVADGVDRARAKLEHSALATAFCGPTFTIVELQDVYEAVWGVRLDPRNFYRKVQSVSGFIVPAGPTRKAEVGRPARLFRSGPRKTLHPPMTRPNQSDRQGEGRSMNSGLVVILTALNLEYEAVRKRLTDLRVHRHPAGTRFEVGRLGRTGCRIALGLVGKGNHPAAVLAERAMSEFSPVAVLFVGVAGALRPSVQLGDVVVASQVYAYHGGTSEDAGLKARPRAWEIPHGAGQIAHHLARRGEWAPDLPHDARPTVHFGPIAAGEVVQDSAVSEQAKWIRQHYNDALAIEMEAAGVAQAGHLNRALPVVVVRGISDRADGSKASTDAEDWQPRAVDHAAAFATALAQELVADGATDRPEPVEMVGRAAMSVTNRNIASGNARVGVQAGQVYGNITIGSGSEPTIDLRPAVADLRALLDLAHRHGHLDEATYAAAQAEVTIASDFLKEDTPQSRTALAVTLKRLRGLVADVTGLDGRLADLAATVRNLID